MMDTQHYPFTLPALPYAYDALVPHLDEQTMHFHHDKHFNAYITNLNAALKDFPAYHDWTLTQLLQNLDTLPAALQTPVRNNAGGALHHDLLFDSLCANTTQPSAALAAAIEARFTSFDSFVEQLKATALRVFGSGWGWLVQDGEGKLQIVSSANQDSPVSQGYRLLLPLDVWEHAYYLHYQNLRADYLTALFHIINWDAVSARMQST